MLENKGSLTPLSEFGEFGLIDHLTKHIKIHQTSTVLGVGDDAAILDFKDEQVLVSTDLLAEGVHFDLAYVPLKHLGYKAVLFNLFDFFAMNYEAIKFIIYMDLTIHITVA